MNRMKYGFFAALVLVSILVWISNGMTQDLDNSKDERVIFEQHMSYEDALKMKKKVEQSEKEKSESELVPMNPLSAVMSKGGEDDSNILKMLKAVLSAMGVEELPEGVDSESEEVKKSDVLKKQGFSRWEDRYEWKGVSTDKR